MLLLYPVPTTNDQVRNNAYRAGSRGDLNGKESTRIMRAVIGIGIGIGEFVYLQLVKGCLAASHHPCIARARRYDKDHPWRLSWCSMKMTR